jgi:hypothetical protein
VRFLKRDADKAVFRLGRREKRQLITVLELYPRVPPAHHQISRNLELPGYDEKQLLLNEALAEQRGENQRLVKEFLAEPGRFLEGPPMTFTVPVGRLEWLLQILNEVRVGSWIAVGAPEDSVLSVLSERTAPNIWVMEAAGYFQTSVLEAITGIDPLAEPDPQA